MLLKICKLNNYDLILHCMVCKRDIKCLLYELNIKFKKKVIENLAKIYYVFIFVYQYNLSTRHVHRASQIILF